MKMEAVVLFEQGMEHPFTETKPLVVKELDLEPPGATRCARCW